MRALYLAVTAVAGLAALAGPARAQGHKVAYLNSQRILAEAPGAAEARTRIQQEMATFQAQVQALQDSLDAMLADYQKKSVLLSPDEKKKQEDAILQRREALGQRVQGIEAQAQAKQGELMAPIMNRIEAVIEAVRKEGGYALIFDVGQQGSPIVSADTTLDVTRSVITRLKGATGSPSSKRP